MLKKSFSPNFQYKLGFHAKPPYPNALKKGVCTLYTLGNIKIHKIKSLGTLKIKLEFYYGGVHGNPIWLLDYPLGGITKIFWVKITSKMKSAPSNYSECKFSAKSDNF